MNPERNVLRRLSLGGDTPVMSMNPTKHNLEKEIYKAFKKRDNREVGIAVILSQLHLGFPFNPRFEYSIESMMKALIFKKLKGIRSQSELVRHLKGHDEDATRLGFFKDEGNKLKIPDQRTFSYFAKRHLDDNKKRLIEFVANTIDRIAEKFCIILDVKTLDKAKDVGVENKSDKTLYNAKVGKTEELCKMIRKKIYPKIKFDIRNNSVYKKSEFLDLLVHIALTEDFAENGSQTLQRFVKKRTPTSDTLLYHLKKYENIQSLQDMFVEVFDIIFKIAKRNNLFGGRKLDISVDFTDWLYYGQDDNMMIHGRKPERGTCRCFRFATINVVEYGKRFTLLALPVSKFDSKEKLVEQLITFAKERISIRRLYVDRGFFSSKIINLLKKMNITFLMPAIMNDRVIDYANSVSPPAVINNYPMIDCKFNLIVLKKGDKRHAFATNIKLSSNDVTLAEKLFLPYSKRWGIETSYRVTKDLRGNTTSRNYLVRMFYFMMAVCLYNLWILIKGLLPEYASKNVKRKLSITAKLFGTILCTTDPGGG